MNKFFLAFSLAIAIGSISTRFCLDQIFGLAALAFEPAAVSQQTGPLSRSVSIELDGFQQIAAGQQMDQWCWAACTEMLFRSQDIQMSQPEIVKRVFGAVRNWPTGGKFDPIAAALLGKYMTRDGAAVSLNAAWNYGWPTDAFGMIKSIQDGRPFVLAWKGHALLAYGLSYTISGRMVLITEIKLIDPYYTFGSKPITNFNSTRDRVQDINGTLELLVLGKTPASTNAAMKSPKGPNASCMECGGAGEKACAECKGLGRILCPTCTGQMFLSCSECNAEGVTVNGTPCLPCKGVGSTDCPTCKAKGTILCNNSKCKKGVVKCEH